MYMPNQLLVPKRTAGVGKRPKRSLYAIVLALFIIVASAFWAVRQEGQAEPTVRETEQLLHDAELLWKWSDTELKNGAAAAEWTVRWNTFAPPGQAKVLASRLFIDAEGKPLDKLVVDNGRTISGIMSSNGGGLAIHTVGTSGKLEELMFIYTTPQNTKGNKTQLMDAIKAISAELSTLDSKFTSSLRVHGLAAGVNVLRAFETQSQSEEVDRYEEGGTVSVTMYTPLLRHRIATKDGMRANVQLATHQANESSSRMLTIGIPIITGDYTSAGGGEGQATK